MTSVNSKKEQKMLAVNLSKKTHFSKAEVESLIVKFDKMMKPTNRDSIDSQCFRDFLLNTFSMTDDIILDRVFKAFDKGKTNTITKEEWVCGLSVFLRGSLQEKIDFCFEVYDLNNDTFISREEMYLLLKNSIVKTSTEEDPEESIRELVELVFKKMNDENEHNLQQVSKDAFTKSVMEENLLLEALGPCLPNVEMANAFLFLISPDDGGANKQQWQKKTAS